MSDPLPKLEALNLAGNYRAQLDILPEDDGVMSRLLTLLQEVDCAGRQVFDANLVATMLEGGVSTLLTANTKHFRRFQSFIELLDMKTVAAEA